MRNEDLDFSSLKTVSSFDRGEARTVAVDASAEELHQFSPSSLLAESLIEQICNLMEKDPKSQRKLYLTVCQKLHQMKLIGGTYQSDEFQFMRSHYQKALYQLLAIAKSTSVEPKALCSAQDSCSLSATPNQAGDLIHWSRYYAEFKELEYIARGGFGFVYKAQHKLDGGVYAIKKIFVKYHSVDSFLQNLKEVKMLAKLNHVNIVSYKNAWLEPSEEKANKTTIKTVDDSRYDSLKTIEDDSLEIVFEGSGKSGSDTVEKSRESGSSMDDVALCELRTHLQRRRYRFNIGPEPHYQSATLFIQMQLCRRTLRQWLDVRNDSVVDVDVDAVTQVFKKVVTGVHYIHSQGIVHHDIKPSNIFVSDDLSEVQVGDFGLACSLLAHPSSTSPSVVTTHQPGQLGTKVYAAPEQLKGICDPKNDIYSLGIVLFELVQPFLTAMERSKMISELKSGHIPTNLTANHPNIAMIISQTVIPSVRKRPTSTDLLDLLENNNSLEIERQNQTILELRRESLAKDAEIAFLKQQLKEISQRDVRNSC